MSITFSKEYTPPSLPSPDQDVENEARETISFHRHCQATVCSAFGTDTGNGRSWHILDDLGDSLSNLPHGWKNHFIENRANITQDFASVLKIIDSVAGQKYTGFNFHVKSGNTTIPLHIENGVEVNLGRDINLSIDGEPLKFNTLKQGDSEVLSMELKRNPLSLIYRDKVLGSVYIPMSEAHEIDLSSIKGTGGESGMSVNYFPEELVPEDFRIEVSDESSVYRIQSDSNVTPEIDLFQYEDYDSGMVRFQLVVENTGENAINVAVPIVTQEDRFFVSPILNNGTLNPGTVGVFSVVVDMRNRIVSMNMDGEYISNPANLTIFEFSDGTSRAVYLIGEITPQKLRDAGILDYGMQWVKSPVAILLGKPVTVIGDDAFSGCSDLVTIHGNTMSRSDNQDNSIPNHIMKIGARAFKGCSALHDMVVHDEVISIGQECFAECSSLEELTIPFIGQAAQATGADAVLGHLFGTTAPIDVEKFASVTQQYGSVAVNKIVRYIPNSLRNITLNNNVEYGIPYGAFNNCTMLEEVILNDKTTGIGEYAFTGCTNIGSLEIPDSVTYIEPSSLSGTSSLGHLRIPFMGTSADSTGYDQLFGTLFQNSTANPPTGFKKVGQTYSASATVKYYFVPESLKDVVLGGSNIGYGAFQNCTMIENVTLSGNPEAIPDCAFKNTGISEIRIPDSVKRIGSESFMNTSLSTIYIGTGLNAIGKNAFNSTGASQYGMKVYVDSVEQWLDMKYEDSATEGSYPFGQTAFSAFEANNPQGSNYLYEKGSYGEYREINRVDVAREVNPYSFCGCKHIHIVSFKLPQAKVDVKTQYGYNIGDYAFYHCENITGNTENIPEDGEGILWILGDTFSIGTGAFQGCKRLDRVWIGSIEGSDAPTSVTIGQYAFNGCYGDNGGVETGIGEVVIRNVKVVGNFSFQGCSRLRKLEFARTSPDIITSNNGFGTGTATAFYGCPIEELHIWDSCHLTATANYTLASLFGNNIKTLVIHDTVDAIAKGALNGLENLQTLTVPFVGTSTTVTGRNRSMGAIFGTTTYGTIGTTTYIAAYEGINPSATNDDTQWIIPMSLTTINVTSDSGMLPDQAFQNFAYLRNVSLNDGITQIGTKAFYGAGINRMELPSVTHIGNRAFKNCQNLDYAQFNGITNPDEILEEAFHCEGQTIQEVHLEGLTLEQIMGKKDYWGLSCAQLHSSDGVHNYS